MNLSKLSPRQLRFTLRQRRLAKRALPERLSAHRRGNYLANLAAKRKQPSRRARHLARLDERDALLVEAREREAEFSAQRPEFVP